MKLLFAQLHTKAFPYNKLIDRGLTPVFGFLF